MAATEHAVPPIQFSEPGRRRNKGSATESRLSFGEKEDGRRFLNELPTHQEAHARAVTSIAR